MIDPPVQEDDPDELTRRYRSASAADPSRPSEAVRAAIAARARAEAEARTARSAMTALDHAAPAANDSHWPVRAAAGLAVVALGVLIMFQVSHHPEAEVLTAQVTTKPAVAIPVSPPTAAPIATAEVPAADTPALPSAAPSARAPERAEVQAVASIETPLVEKMADSAAELPAPAVAARQSGSGATAVVGAAPPPDAVARARDPAADRALVARYFPEVFRNAADEPPIWVLLDRTGHVVQTGRHASADEAELRAYLERRISGARIDELQKTTVNDGLGRTVAVTFAWIARDSTTPGEP